MAKKRLKSKTKFISILIIILFSVCSYVYQNYEVKEYNQFEPKTNNIIDKNINNESLLEIHFIDVGQADSILIIQGNNTMLIDGGNDENGAQIIQYIENKNISNIDYVIGTHAHADHIGGLDKIINHFEIGKIYFPKQTSTTKNFEEFVLAVKNKNMKLSVPKVSEEFLLGKAVCKILSPQEKEYEEANDYSIVLKITYGNTSYLLMGDAETGVEKTLLNSDFDISADVLKVGHHGSKTSSSIEFLKEVNPKYAIISVGKNNDYNLPSSKIIDRINNLGINIMRTDKLGTIVLKSDGTNINFEK